jgi:hypothetical protein
MVNRRSKLRIPQGLRPAFLQALNGTAEAMPYPKPIRVTRSSYCPLAYCPLAAVTDH